MPAILLRVPWRHQTVIVSKCKTILEAIFYLNQVIEGNLSRNELEHIIEAHLYEQKGKALNNFESTLPAPQKALANEMLKDPYKLDFLSMAGDFSEKDLEDKLAQNITRFFTRTGQRFCLCWATNGTYHTKWKIILPRHGILSYQTQMLCCD